MDKLLTEENLLYGIAISLTLNIICFFTTVIISFGWTYILARFLDWDYLMYLCVFYGINIFLMLLIKKWYENYLRRKKKRILLLNRTPS